ncbi:MBL fold metallo-hydrolase [Candidatus Epulonipiscium fishelsonii]|uniref:MBL fold metallo-hydrolase n=1 Tax=Candidatus Epulonipiscium fishelsonii TaxID=77094 RepID=A0ACC8XGG8_9FIRM|nr:MBL fold metallo-hydrolase [Epulopiscium sp. SCG-B05WGA-EpuloA1]ONI42638.1 MBL fold metallo-hydrolase [Epulopiscium sp. SCG-B11WGA-EpuloA1]ONI47262.1 MBL fold metallo-hydrolase [Epulopiscium sp. SCG-C06WGA-EpuloA1]
MKLCTIASGSTGNCTYVRTDKSKILIDVGISGKKAYQGLDKIGVSPLDIQAIFITHEHLDHIRGAGVFSRKYNIPIFATYKTWQVINTKIGKIETFNKKIIEVNDLIIWKDLTIKAFKINHDAVDPVGFILEHNNKKVGILTDVGEVDTAIIKELQDCNGLVLEFNHDENMVLACKYPYKIKRRILGRYGHLCNDKAAKFLIDIYNKKLEWVVLAHLSNDNNVPELAYITAKTLLDINNISLILHVAKKEENSPIFSV